MTTKKNMIIGIVVLLIVAAGSFYGGTVYQKSQGRAGFAGATATFGARGQFGGTQGGTAGARNFGGGTAGSVIAKDATSFTVQIMGGGSKIVLYTPSTTVSKSAAGSMDDIAVGTNVVVMGTGNQDGSVTAESVRITPAPQAAAPAPAQ